MRWSRPSWRPACWARCHGGNQASSWFDRQSRACYPKKVELTFAAATDIGRQRTHNEDNFLIDKKLRLFLVADGMGGHAAGEIASSIAVHEIRDAVFNSRELIDRYRVDHPGVQGYEILQEIGRASCRERE